MANMCSNVLILSGEPDNLNKVVEELELMRKSNDSGSYPSFSKEPDRAFFDMYFDTESPGLIHVHYETKWAPNPLSAQEICQHFNVNGELHYDEFSNNIHGKAYIPSEGDIIDVCLAPHQLPKWINSKQCYKLNGFDIQESELYEYLDKLLEQEDVLQQHPEWRYLTKRPYYYANRLSDWAYTFEDLGDVFGEDDEEKPYETAMKIHKYAEKLRRGICTKEDFTEIAFHLNQKKGLT